MKKYTILGDMQVQSKVEDAISKIEKELEIEINLKDWTWDYKKSIEERCCEMLDELNKTKISQSTMTEICKPFCTKGATFSTDAFICPPKHIQKYSQLLEYLAKTESSENTIHNIIVFMNNNGHRNIDLWKDEYWIYQDGVNWETWISTQDNLIGYIKSTIETAEEEQIKKLYEILV